MFKGLSTDQAPPISVPFRFFLTAPIFAIIIAILLFTTPLDTILNRYSAEAIGITHLFTLGILSMIIIGALQQMLPVLAGAVIKKPLIFANIIHTSLTIGTLSLSFGFIYTKSYLLITGAIFLSIAFISFFFTVIKLLFKVKYLTSTVNAMKLFSIVGTITILLGLYLAGSHISGNIHENHYIFVQTHILFGIFGFSSIIIMGVAFQVIPMFYVAQDLPKYIQNKFPRIIFGMLVLFFIFTLLKLETYGIKVVFATLLSIFAFYGIKSLNNRRRPVFDVTLWYWKISLISLIISMFLYIKYPESIILPIMISLGFLYSILQGMIYKIVPFLSWFHLNSKGYFVIPTLREFIKENNIKLQLYIYVSSVFFFILGVILSKIFIYVGGCLFVVSNILLFINIATSAKRYHEISLTNPMDAFK
jgi:hypothetical protein